MTIDAGLMDELQLLAHYPLTTMQEGIKVHSSADARTVAAAQRLYQKGLTTQSDGGYLTDLGHEAVEHLQALLTIVHT